VPAFDDLFVLLERNSRSPQKKLNLTGQKFISPDRSDLVLNGRPVNRAGGENSLKEALWRKITRNSNDSSKNTNQPLI
jgi:hypothetical protein